MNLRISSHKASILQTGKSPFLSLGGFFIFSEFYFIQIIPINSKLIQMLKLFNIFSQEYFCKKTQRITLVNVEKLFPQSDFERNLELF